MCNQNADHDDEEGESGDGTIFPFLVPPSSSVRFFRGGCESRKLLREIIGNCNPTDLPRLKALFSMYDRSVARCRV
jgi:hypothetical protein